MDDHAQRIRQFEVATAVAGTAGESRHRALMDRWSTLSAELLLVLGSIASAATKFLTNLIGGRAA